MSGDAHCAAAFGNALSQDLPGCMSVDEVRKVMRLDEVEAKRGMPVPCIGTTCKDRQASSMGRRLGSADTPCKQAQALQVHVSALQCHQPWHLCLPPVPATYVCHLCLRVLCPAVQTYVAAFDWLVEQSRSHHKPRAVAQQSATGSAPKPSATGPGGEDIEELLQRWLEVRS